MRILVTNDDGVEAAGLVPLIRWCQTLGQVTTVVPRVEQSGKSHGIELHKSFPVQERILDGDIPVWALDSTPADCVRFAVFGLGAEFDLVISGVNRGYNVGADMMYSGTVAAVCEAKLLGIPAIALSTCPENYAVVHESLAQVWACLEEKTLLDVHDLYNINIPPQPKGYRFTRQGGPYYSDDFLVENGMVTPKGKCVYENTFDLTVDTDAVTAGYISITPMTISMTHHEILSKLH